MSITARSVIRLALERIRVVSAFGTVRGEDEQRAFVALTGLMGRWNAKQLLKPAGAASPYTLVNGTASYTVGPTGTLVGARPSALDVAKIIPSGQTYELPLRILTRQEWQDQADKVSQGEPWAVHYEATAPDGTLTVLWVPNRNASIVLYHTAALPTFADLTTAYTFQDGFDETLELNLARRIAPLFGKRLDPDSMDLAAEGLRDLIANAEGDAVPQLEYSGPVFGQGIFDPTTGEIR